MKRLVCLLALLGGFALIQAAPTPLPRRERRVPPPATEVVVILTQGEDPLPRIEVTVGTRTHVLAKSANWDQELAGHLQALRADPKTPAKLVAVCDSDELTPSCYIQFARTCKKAGFAQYQLKTEGQHR